MILLYQIILLTALVSCGASETSKQSSSEAVEGLPKAPESELTIEEEEEELDTQQPIACKNTMDTRHEGLQRELITQKANADKIEFEQDFFTYRYRRLERDVFILYQNASAYHNEGCVNICRAKCEEKTQIYEASHRLWLRVLRMK